MQFAIRECRLNPEDTNTMQGRVLCGSGIGHYALTHS